MNYSVDAEDFLKFISQRTEILRDCAELIRAGVRDYNPTSDKAASPYALPRELFAAFLKIVLFFVGAGSYASQLPSAETSGKKIEGTPSSYQYLEIFSTAASNLMNDAKMNLIAMVRTGLHVGDAHGPVEVEELLAIIVTNMENDLRLHSQTNLIDMYSEYISRLQMEIQEYPSRRVLQDLNHVSEELQIVKNFLRDRISWLREWMDIGYRSGGSGIAPRNKILERALITTISMRNEALKELQEQVEALRTQVPFEFPSFSFQNQS